MSAIVYRSILTWTALCAAAGALAISLRAADPASGKAPDLKSAVKTASESDKAINPKRTEVEEALDTPVTLKYKTTPLKEVAATISDLAKINVLLDVKSLTEASITPDTEVNFSCEKLPLHVALRLMLRQMDMNFVTAADNALLITTEARSRESLVERVYDVRDLLSPSDIVQQRRAAGRAVNVAIPASVTFPDNEPNEDTVVDLLESCIAPTSWTEAGGSGSISAWNGSLVIEQTDDIQRQIVQLLNVLHEATRRDRNSPPSSAVLDDDDARQTSAPFQALNARNNFDLVAVPMKELVEMLGKLGLHVMLDEKSMTEASITPDTEITFHAKNIRIADGLRLLLRDMDLNFVVDHGVVVISTEAYCKEHITLAVYPAGDLVEPGVNGESPDYQDLIDVITTSALPTSWTESGGSASIMPLPAARVLVISQTQEGHAACIKLLSSLRAQRREKPAAADPQELVVRKYPLLVKPESMDQCITIIQTTIEPKSWKAEGVLALKVENMLVIRQTRAVHAQIQSLLTSLALDARQGPLRGGLGSGAAPASAPGGSGFGSGAF